jgi:hypothetical protein
MGETMNLLETVVDALWEGFEAEVCVDRPLNRICDTGDHDWSMKRVAAHVIATLGLREELKQLYDGVSVQKVSADGTIVTFNDPPARATRPVGKWIPDSGPPPP